MTKEVKEVQEVAKLSGFAYEYTGELEGAVPGVGLVKRGQVITPTHAEHEQTIKSSGLFKRVPKTVKAEEPAKAGKAPKATEPEVQPEVEPAAPAASGKDGEA